MFTRPTYVRERGRGRPIGEAYGMGLVVSGVILAVAEVEGFDLGSLRLPAALRRPPVGGRADGCRPALLDWAADTSDGLDGRRSAWRFFEKCELFPGLVVRNWHHPKGRLGFGLEGDRVSFELHLRRAGLLISGTPEGVRISLRDVLPETVCVSLVGRPLERLVVWPPASGPDYPIVAVEVVDGLQVVTLSTTP